MAFFNKLGEKISSGATAVSDSAKRMAETNKLNGRINSALSEINKKYTEIGRAVKLRLLDTVDDEEVKSLAAEIDALLSEVSQMKEQVNTLKGLKNCSGCGASINADVVFCPICGTKQEVKAAKSEQLPITEAECSQPAAVPQFVPSDEFKSEAAPESTEAQEFQPVISEKPEAASIFCTECGHKETPGTKFCSECGNKLA